MFLFVIILLVALAVLTAAALLSALTIGRRTNEQSYALREDPLNSSGQIGNAKPAPKTATLQTGQ